MGSLLHISRSRTSTRLPPRSDLEQLRLIHQGTVYPRSARRIDLLTSTQFKQRKQIIEWIESFNPNGIEILTRLSQSRTDFADLIKRIIPDFLAVEQRAAVVFARESIEFGARKDDVTASLEKGEVRLAGLRTENVRLMEEIEREKNLEESLRNELRKWQPMPVAATRVERTVRSPAWIRDLIDPVVFFTRERERLEETLEKLEERFGCLSRELVGLHSTFPRASEAGQIEG
jgi:hypothetical protein